jgi:acetyl-CoA acyltransferase
LARDSVIRITAAAWEEGKLSAEVMTAYASPFREPLEQDNNIRKNSTGKGIAAQITQRRQTQLFGPRLGHQDHRRRAIRQLALERAGLTLADLTLIDMHEAFAAQTLANLQCLARARRKLRAYR